MLINFSAQIILKLHKRRKLGKYQVRREIRHGKIINDMKRKGTLRKGMASWVTGVSLSLHILKFSDIFLGV